MSSQLGFKLIVSLVWPVYLCFQLSIRV